MGQEHRKDDLRRLSVRTATSGNAERKTQYVRTVHLGKKLNMRQGCEEGVWSQAGRIQPSTGDVERPDTELLFRRDSGQAG